jgi:probable HAF family extracellular repeat protein
MYTIKDLGTLGGTYSSAYSINDSGQVVGRSKISNGAYHAFLHSGGQMQDLHSGPISGFVWSAANDINDSGQVVGEEDTSCGPTHAALYSGGQMRDLGTLAGDTCSFSEAWGINDTSEVVGLSATSVGRRHAFLYTGGNMQDLGTLPGGTRSGAHDINNTSQVVGASTTSSGAFHAFVFSGGYMQDLNDLIPANSGWELTSADAINTSGQIVGEGEINGQTRAFLATPATSTPDTTSPKVNSTSPANGATRIAPGVNVTATFTEAMDASTTDGDPSTINGTTFKLMKAGTTTAIGAVVSYDASANKAILNPNANLRLGTKYKAVVTTEATDLAGNRLDQNSSLSGLQQKAWTFTTRN